MNIRLKNVAEKVKSINIDFKQSTDVNKFLGILKNVEPKISGYNYIFADDTLNIKTNIDLSDAQLQNLLQFGELVKNEPFVR